MPGHPDHVVMTGDDPQLVLLIPGDRVLFSEVTIIPKGIGDHVGGKHIVVNRHASHHLSSSVNHGSNRDLPRHADTCGGSISSRKSAVSRCVAWDWECHGIHASDAMRSGRVAHV